MSAGRRFKTAVAVAAAAMLAVAPSALAAPANDDLASATTLAGERGTADLDLADSTLEASEPDATGSDGLSVWFKYTPGQSGLASFSICRRDPGLQIEGAAIGAYNGSSIPVLSQAGLSTGDCPAGSVNAALNGVAVTAGVTYSIRVSAQSASTITGGTLTYDFNAAVPANDDFANAQNVSGSLPQTIDADNGLATREASEPGLQDWGPSNSLWYRWTADADGVLSVDTCATTDTGSGTDEVDSKLSAYTGSGVAPVLAELTQVANGDDGCPQPHALLTHMYVSVQSGTEYWIRLANYSEEFGHAYKLRLRWVGAPETTAPPYITPLDPTAIEGQTFSVSGYEWSAYPVVTSLAVQWLRCDSSGLNCAAIADATGTSYVAQHADAGHRLSVRVTASNGVQTTTAEAAPTAVVEPLVPDGGGPAEPPAPVDPLPALTLPKSLGTVKLKAGKVKLTKLKVVCGATATGPCAGKLTITVGGKKTVVKLSVRPGAAMPTTFTLSKATQKFVKKAKKAKGSVKLDLGAPGFSQKSAASAVVLKAA